jgi:G3E family GTPase
VPKPDQVTGKLPVILVTGFLGSGKTTFLRRLATDHPEWSLLFLVNEFAETGIDAETLEDTGLPTQSVVGGSLFCECKAAEFVKVMRETVQEIHRQRKLEAVVIETSGIADPDAIGHLMRDHGLSDLYEVQRIVTIVAPGNLEKLLRNLPVVRVQIETSDLVIINKTDLASEEQLASAMKSVLGINPMAEVVTASYCDVDISLRGTARTLPHGPLSTCESNPFSTAEVEIPAACSIKQVKAAIAQVPPEILRVKGFVKDADGSWSVERTVDTLEVMPYKREAVTSRLILIAHDDHEDLLESAKTALEDDFKPK